MSDPATLQHKLCIAKNKRDRQEMTTYHYAKISHHLLSWLEYEDDAARMYCLWQEKEKNVNKKYEPKNYKVSYEDPIYGSVGIRNMAAAFLNVSVV